MNNYSKGFLLTALLPLTAFSNEKPTNAKEVQDMSDPLAVYTQAGVGATNKGINVKVGKSYDPGKPKTMAMNIIEIKGILGDSLGWDDDNKKDNSIDSIRFRNFKVDMTNGRGGQVDFVYNFDETGLAKKSADISYSLIQALPKVWRLNFYPLAGVGASIAKDAVEEDGSIDDGFSFNGAYGLIGMYSKLTITDKIWLNYNPFWLAAITGSDMYKDNAYGANNSTVLTHEFVLSYQINPKLNVRYFANWNQYNSFSDGDQRLEVNYQF